MKKIMIIATLLIIAAFFLSTSYAADKKAISPVILSPIEKDKQTVIFTNKYEIKTISRDNKVPIVILWMELDTVEVGGVTDEYRN